MHMMSMMLQNWKGDIRPFILQFQNLTENKLSRRCISLLICNHLNRRVPNPRAVNFHIKYNRLFDSQKRCTSIKIVKEREVSAVINICLTRVCWSRWYPNGSSKRILYPCRNNKCSAWIWTFLRQLPQTAPSVRYGIPGHLRGQPRIWPRHQKHLTAQKKRVKNEQTKKTKIPINNIVHASYLAREPVPVQKKAWLSREQKISLPLSNIPKMDHSLARTQLTCQINLLPVWNDDPPSWAQMSMEQLVPSRLQIWLTVAPFLIKASALCHKSYLRGARCSGRKLRASVDTNCRSSEYSCPPGKDKDKNLKKNKQKEKKQWSEPRPRSPGWHQVLSAV